MVSSTIQAQIINIPDTNFKNKLLLPNNAKNLQGHIVSIDANGNGEIEVSETQNISIIGLGLFGNANINDLTGLEYFVNIRAITVSNTLGNSVTNNQISQFNFPTLTLLESINLGNNQLLTSFNVSNHPNLKALYTNDTQIAHLNFPPSNNLIDIGAGSQPLTAIDVKDSPNLMLLKINNTNTSSINIKNTNLNFNHAGMLWDCWANIPLTYICCDAEDVPALTAFLTNCGHNMSAITIDTTNTCALSSGVFKSYAIKVYPNPSTGVFNLNLPAIFNAEVEVFNTLWQKVYQNNVKNQQDVVLDLGHLNKGLYLLKVNTENGDKFQEKIVVN